MYVRFGHPSGRCHSSGMWVDYDGVAHTVALPRPKQLMTKSFRVSLEVLVQSDPDAVQAALEIAEEQVFEVEPAAAAPEVEARFVGLPPPRKILRGSVEDVSGLVAALDRVDQRWRLDAILALHDYID